MPLKLVRIPRSPYWYLRGTVRGARIFESTGLVRREDAEEALAVRAHELVQRTVHGDRVSRTFAEAALSYLEAGGDGTHLAPIIKRLGRTTVARIGQFEIDACARALKPGRAPATLNRHIYTPIAAVLHHAARLRWCDRPIIARPKEPRGRVRWITHDEAERLIAAAAPHLRPLVVFLFSTGCRLSEALYLDWRQVDLCRGHVVFLHTKNGERRGVPLHPRAVAELANMRHRTGPVFRTSAGLGYASRGGKSGGQVKTAWASMLARAGIQDFSPHDCRHTWATWHYAANRDLPALMELGGWKSVAMVMRYAHVNTSHLAASVGRLWIGEESVNRDSSDPKFTFCVKG